MGGGGSGTQSTGSSNLYTYKDILPPWVQAGQQRALPYLMQRVSEGGMLPAEERALWGQAKGTIEESAMSAGKELAKRLAMSGLSASSPMVGGAYSDLAVDKLSQTSKAALDFAKLKMGARDTAIGQMLTALYTPPPVAVGQTSQTTSGGK